VSDNSKTNTLYKCVDCGKLRQGITSAAVKRCSCGGMLCVVRKP
jgi:DNA-directed RNA polymerase subunit RPC12/RpoP